MRKYLVILLPLVTIGGPLAACSSDSTSTPDTVDAANTDSNTGADTNKPDTNQPPQDSSSEEAATPTMGSIKVDTTYTGSQTGTLAIGIFAGPDISGVPVDGARISSPTFPNSKTFTNETPGQYTVIVYLDVGNDSPTGPGPGDVIAHPTLSTFTVDAGATATVTKDLDPISDAGSDG